MNEVSGPIIAVTLVMAAIFVPPRSSLASLGNSIANSL